MQEPLKEMASVLMTQVESLIKIAELVETKAFLKLDGVAEKAALVKEKYVSTCSEVEGLLGTAPTGHLLTLLEFPELIRD